MANAMKKTAKPQTSLAKNVLSAAKPTSKSAVKPVAAKANGKVKADSGKPLSDKATSRTVAHSEPKAASVAIAKPSTRTASMPAEKTSSGGAASAASAQSKTTVTTKKLELKPGKPGKPTELSSVKSDVRPPDMSVQLASGVSQTTDAATLAAIDTSGYILPSVKVPGRRGRKPKEFQPENEEVAALNAVERAEI
jgi:RNA polymerase primary sigma factor